MGQWFGRIDGGILVRAGRRELGLGLLGGGCKAVGGWRVYWGTRRVWVRAAKK